MTLWMVRTSWMRESKGLRNGQSAAKRLSNGERSETVRDGMGRQCTFTRTGGLFNIQSDPCESRAAGEEGGGGNAPLESPGRGAKYSSTWMQSNLISPQHFTVP